MGEELESLENSGFFLVLFVFLKSGLHFLSHDEVFVA